MGKIYNGTNRVKFACCYYEKEKSWINFKTKKKSNPSNFYRVKKQREIKGKLDFFFPFVNWKYKIKIIFMWDL